MRKLLLAASLCIAASVLTSVASASAATFAGSCTITGTAKFTNENGSAYHLKKHGDEEKFYNFKSGPVLLPVVGSVEATKCTGAAVEGTTVKEVLPTDTIVAEVGGKAELGCEKSKGSEGVGRLEDTTKGTTATFSTFTFIGVGTQVTFYVGAPPTAAGEASFAADTGGVNECVNPALPEGPEKLSFVATTSGVIVG